MTFLGMMYFEDASTPSLLIMTQEAFVGSVDQDWTAKKDSTDPASCDDLSGYEVFWRCVYSFLTDYDTRSFCGQRRSRSDCKKCPV